MAVNPIPVTNSQLDSAVLTALRTRTNFTTLSAGAKARSLLDALNDVNKLQATRLEVSQIVNLASKATGQMLDDLGDILGLKRRGATVSASDGTSRAVEFYVEDSTFGAINGGLPINLTANETEVFTATPSTASRNTQTFFFVTEDIQLDPSLSSQFVPVRATLSGPSGNVDAGQIRDHNVNYLDIKNKTLLVRNIESIVSGKSAEDDNSYRYRIVNFPASLAKANELAVRIAVLSIPGVANVRTIRYSRGIGTVDMIVRATTASTPDSLLAICRSVASEVESAGCYTYLTKPRETGIQVELTVRYRESVPLLERSLIEERIAAAIRTYIDNLDTEEQLIVNELVQVVMDVDERILDIGLPNKPFDAINAFVASKVTGKTKRTVYGNYNTAVDEKLLLEPSITDPIIIHINEQLNGLSR